MMGIDKNTKHEKFIGNDFKRWQKRMIFWLKTMKIFSTYLGFEENINDHEYYRTTSKEKFENDDCLCHG